MNKIEILKIAKQAAIAAVFGGDAEKYCKKFEAMTSKMIENDRADLALQADQAQDFFMRHYAKNEKAGFLKKLFQIKNLDELTF